MLQQRHGTNGRSWARFHGNFSGIFKALLFICHRWRLLLIIKDERVMSILLPIFGSGQSPRTGVSRRWLGLVGANQSGELRSNYLAVCNRVAGLLHWIDPSKEQLRPSRTTNPRSIVSTRIS